MGIIKGGILGPVSGKVGSVIGSSWKGIAYLKGIPASVANPRTAAQIAQRTLFANCVAFGKPILAGLIKPLRDRFAVRQSGWNTYMSDNIDLFAAALPVPPADFVLSSGSMAETAISNVAIDDADTTVEVHWVDDSGEGFKLATDKVYVFAINITTGVIAIDSAVSVRSDLVATTAFPENAASADVCEVYLSFLRADGTIVSTNSHIQKVVA